MGILISSILLYLMSFITLKGYPLLVDVAGIAGTLLIFAGFSFICTVLMMWTVPETKGKSFQEIKQIMEK